MTEIDLKNPSKLDVACARLDAAVQRVESALDAQNDTVLDNNLKSDLPIDLESDLMKLRKENALLKNNNKYISEQLTKTIIRLKEFLEGF